MRGQITGARFGVQLLGGSLVLTNAATITGTLGAVRGSTGVDKVTSWGTMTRQVDLADGTDLLDGRGDQFRGSVLGGNGDNKLDFAATEHCRTRSLAVRAMTR